MKWEKDREKTYESTQLNNTYASEFIYVLLQAINYIVCNLSFQFHCLF